MGPTRFIVSWARLAARSASLSLALATSSSLTSSAALSRRPARFIVPRNNQPIYDPYQLGGKPYELVTQPALQVTICHSKEKCTMPTKCNQIQSMGPARYTYIVYYQSPDGGTFMNAQETILVTYTIHRSTRTIFAYGSICVLEYDVKLKSLGICHSSQAFSPCGQGSQCMYVQHWIPIIHIGIFGLEYSATKYVNL